MNNRFSTMMLGTPVCPLSVAKSVSQTLLQSCTGVGSVFFTVDRASCLSLIGVSLLAKLAKSSAKVSGFANRAKLTNRSSRPPTAAIYNRVLPTKALVSGSYFAGPASAKLKR
mgnify:CR=1 FL=1